MSGATVTKPVVPGASIRASTAKVPPAGAAKTKSPEGSPVKSTTPPMSLDPPKNEPKPRGLERCDVEVEQTEAQPLRACEARAAPELEDAVEAGDAEADRVQPARPRRNHAALDPEVERRPAALEGEIEGHRDSGHEALQHGAEIRREVGQVDRDPDAARRVFREGREG